MFNRHFARKAKLALVTAMAFGGGTLFTSCGLTDIRDNLIAGALSGVKGTASTWIDGLLPDFNEFIEAIPDDPIDTP